MNTFKLRKKVINFYFHIFKHNFLLHELEHQTDWKFHEILILKLTGSITMKFCEILPLSVKDAMPPYFPKQFIWTYHVTWGFGFPVTSTSNFTVFFSTVSVFSILRTNFGVSFFSVIKKLNTSYILIHILSQIFLCSMNLYLAYSR